MSYQVGTTVRGVFPVEAIQGGSLAKLTLLDHHSVVLAVNGDTLLLAYAGTDDDAANARKPGYMSFPGDVSENLLAGWRIGGRYFIDAGVLAFVPANKVARVGRLNRKMTESVLSRAGAIRQSPLSYSTKDPVKMTGARRQEKTRQAIAA